MLFDILNQKKRKEEEKKKIFAAALISSVIGGVVAIFFSPASGKENREAVKKGFADASKKTEDLYQKKGVPFVNQTTEEVRKAIDTVSKEFERMKKKKPIKEEDIELVKDSENKEDNKY